MLYLDYVFNWRHPNLHVCISTLLILALLAYLFSEYFENLDPHFLHFSLPWLTSHQGFWAKIQENEWGFRTNNKYNSSQSWPSLKLCNGCRSKEASSDSKHIKLLKKPSAVSCSNCKWKIYSPGDKWLAFKHHFFPDIQEQISWKQCSCGNGHFLPRYSSNTCNFFIIHMKKPQTHTSPSSTPIQALETHWCCTQFLHCLHFCIYFVNYLKTWRPSCCEHVFLPPVGALLLSQLAQVEVGRVIQKSLEPQVRDTITSSFMQIPHHPHTEYKHS